MLKKCTSNGECASSNQNIEGKSKPYFHLFNPYKIIVSIFEFDNLFNPQYLLFTLR